MIHNQKTIYIAASWKHQHAVEMLTDILMGNNYDVKCFVRNCYQPDRTEADNNFDFESWVETPMADKCFKYDVDGATLSDLVIYIGPSGKDAAAECGAAWAKCVPIIGLHAKGEDFGLMRKMFTKWFDDYKDMIEYVNELLLP